MSQVVSSLAFAFGLASLALVAFLLSPVILRRRVRDKGGNLVPNGPIGLPIVGCFPWLTSYPELALHQWAKTYGSLYSLWLGDQFFVIISDPIVAKDLLITNGAVFSSRKEMFTKCQTIFAWRGITVTPYTEKWRRDRRIATGYLNPRAVESYASVLDFEGLELLRELYARGKAGVLPINPQPHVGRYALNNMLTIVFGIRTDSIEHPLVTHALRISREFMNCTGPMSNLIDFIPLLQKLPIYMRTRGKELHKDIVKTYGELIRDIEVRMKRDEDVPDCLAKTLILTREEEGLDDLDVPMLTAAFMIGGVESTGSIMQWFCALIPAYPEIQAKAHAELDRVVGRNRLPTFEDEKDLPYIHAIVKEVERCHNPFWLGTPHFSTEDFVYGQTFIPKNTVLVLNTYAMHHDPRRHAEPHKFNPDRYLNDSTTSAESANLPDPNERDHWMFGAGRRICPAMLFAEREIWLALSRILWAFTMEEIPGEPIDLKEYDGLSGRSPVPFRIRMVPRNEKIGAVLDD